jgi:hypothetical protein
VEDPSRHKQCRDDDTNGHGRSSSSEEYGEGRLSPTDEAAAPKLQPTSCTPQGGDGQSKFVPMSAKKSQRGGKSGGHGEEPCAEMQAGGSCQ